MGSKGSGDFQLVTNLAQLLHHVSAGIVVDGSVDLNVEIILPGVLFQGSASQGSHIIAISADDADGLRQGTGFILNGKHQDRIGKGGTVCHDFGKDSKPGGILTALVDVCLQNVQPVKLGGFRTGNGTVGFVLFFGYQLGGYSGVGCFLCVETPECNVVMALTKGLGMTGDLPDILYNCS